MDLFNLTFDSFRVFMYSWIILAGLIFFLLLKVTAPYGRHSSAKWGPLISNRLGWVIMELPVLVVVGLFIFPYRDTLSTPVWVMIGLFSCIISTEHSSSLSDYIPRGKRCRC
ncbi:MAG: hypothetical protein IPP31_03060 [Chitinophagaceae bacterium]|nr:hypothetical protein [Chitinophagaceae bacterium]